jgi:hypothetical protein
MMKKLSMIIISVAIMNFFSCENGTSPSGQIDELNYHWPEINWPEEIDYGSEIIYYGTNLAPFPPKVREWVINVAFTKEKMEQPYMTNSELKVWWSDDNNEVLFEASYIITEGYVGAGTIATWGQGARYSGNSAIFDIYGEYAKYKTLRFEWELKLETERLLKNDPAYAEIIEFAKQLCDEIEYDWANYSAYNGPVKPNASKKHFVCGGYANEVMDRIFILGCVQAVQKWSSPGHAWNIIQLVDGRTLFFDLTWFDNEDINEETGEIYQTDDYGWENITFYTDLFRYSNIGYGVKIFHHNAGKFVNEIMKK